MYFLLRTDGFYSKTYKLNTETLVVLPLAKYQKPLPDRQGLSLSKKPRRVWRRKPPNKIKIIFCRGVYLTENTSQAAGLAPQRCAERNRRRRLLARRSASGAP